MHVFLILSLALPLFVAAQVQKPLKEKAQGWFDKAKSYIPTAAATAPIDAGAAKVADKVATKLNAGNWQSTLSSSSSVPHEGPEEWMILVTGGNKSCYGQCTQVERAWNQSVPLLAATPKSPNLGYVNCDSDALLCSIWVAAVPSLWYIQLPSPAPDQSKPATTLHILPLSLNQTTAQDIVKIHTEKTYSKVAPYEGAFHPIDGILAKLGLLVPLGYIMHGFGVIPSWMFMIGISFISRNIMSRRMGAGSQRTHPSNRGGPAQGSTANR